MEAWPAAPDGDTQTIVYNVLREGWVRDTRGLPVPGAAIRGGADPNTPFASAADGRYEAYSFGGFNPQTVTHPGYGEQPAYDNPGWRVLHFDATLPPKSDAIRNGGFEDALQGWQVVGSEGVARENSGHTGKGSARLGIHAPLKPGTYGISQQVTVPAASAHPTLSFLAARDTADMPFSMLAATVTAADGATTALPLTWREEPEWSHAWADLSAFGGKTVTLTLTITQTGWEVGGAALIDEVTVGEWRTPSITAISAGPELPGEITVRGGNFEPGATISLDDTALATTYVDGGTLTAVIPADAKPGPRVVWVTNPGGQQAQGSARLGQPVFLPVMGGGD